ncbi:uncharacterized protein si:dkey-86e18.1 isoform X2 [Electrophorus electricus]|uniref:uncharacterized protein si:dkey-86e18.1 isoform X2 n=1 Tax=Electrophorus electricus TaxID=8005 RepID=UPI000F0A958B|nr:uncharacterized protein si:dkey-86e18.1 isoform X2 [Electrophorus electricus]
MARNEEKQLGRLNRLWLQKEKEDGRIKDVNESRPKLATLNSAQAVRKWIPSIKNELEYYLQSQLSHYPERKIAEFQQQIENLEKEYKRYLKKLRSLDPTCKHKPWTPRAYSKRRPDSDSSQCIAKRLCVPDHSQVTAEEKAATLTPKNQAVPGSSAHPASDLPDQDLPLSFDRTRLAVVVAGARGVPSRQPQTTSTLVHVLHSGLPNLLNSPVAAAAGPEDRAGTNIPDITQTRKGHVLGLGCYSSSSDEET